MKINLKCETNFSELKNIEKEVFKINSKSVLFIVDMNNGFVKEGALSSERVKNIIPNVVKTVECFEILKAPIIAFTDWHKKDSVEFEFYPKHCLQGSIEAELIDELKVFGDKIKLIKKSTTNAFLEIETEKVINELITEGYENLVIIGCVTDICVKQFAITLRNYLNKINSNIKVIVPINSIETFDTPWHNGDSMNLYALYDMLLNGIK
ncbi:isochorismatase family cysteine hydrolase, partial [Clostridium tarantellae]